jgi:hypothetical protein
MKSKQSFKNALHLLNFVCILAIMVSIVSCEKSKDDNNLLVGILAIVLNQQQPVSNTSCSGTGSCKMFVSVANAVLNAGISGLDNQCASDTNKPSGGGTYKAMVADGTNRIACTTANCATGGTSEHTDWVLKPNKEYRRADGTTVVGTTTANGVFSFPLTSVVQTTVVGTNSTVTGISSSPAWTSSASDCSNFANTGANTSNGLHDDATVNLLSIGTSGCGNAMKIICVEQ